jgi:hypothetical protein
MLFLLRLQKLKNRRLLLRRRSATPLWLKFLLT